MGIFSDTVYHLIFCSTNT